MKSLKNYITEKHKYAHPSLYGYTFESFLENNNLTETSVTPEQMLWYAFNVFDNYKCTLPRVYVTFKEAPLGIMITEMLKNRIDSKKLISELNRNLCSSKQQYVKLDKTLNKSLITIKVPLSIFNKQIIAETCKKFLWEFTGIYDTNGKSHNPVYVKDEDLQDWFAYQDQLVLLVEQINFEDCTQHIINDCNSTLYHICTKKQALSILKTGLRMKGNNVYRYIDKKVFLVSGTDKTLEKNIKDVAKSLGCLTQGGVLKDNWCILKVSLENYNINFYKDPLYNDIGIVYTYAYIPPTMISLCSM